MQPYAPAEENRLVSRLRDRGVSTAGTRGELTPCELGRPTEIKCARCAGCRLWPVRRAAGSRIAS